MSFLSRRWLHCAAIAAALAFLAVFWVVYDRICRSVGETRGKVGGDALVGVLVLGFVVAASWLACHLSTLPSAANANNSLAPLRSMQLLFFLQLR